MGVYLEAVLFMLGVYFAGYGLDELRGDSFDLLINGAKLGLSVALDIPLKFCKGDLIKILKLAVLLPLLLYSVIGQVYQLILQILQGINLAGGSHVALLIPVALHAAVYAGDQHVATHVEFALVVEIRVLDVFLDY